MQVPLPVIAPHFRSKSLEATGRAIFLGVACLQRGMALGGWLAGLLYDYLGYHAPAFAVGIGANILNLLMVSVLVARKRHHAVAV